MAEEDDYESLPQTSSMSTHMLAGAAAGIMEHCVMYPVDCVKVGIKQPTLCSICSVLASVLWIREMVHDADDSMFSQLINSNHVLYLSLIHI